MIRRPIVSLLLGSSALLGLSSFHQARADSASDAQIKALQLEMQAMRREMSGQISVLRQRLVRAEAVRSPEAANAAQARRVAASHGQPLPDSYARDIHIGGDSGMGGSMASAMQKADLGNAATALRGGQQTVWSAGLNWYPNRHFRFMLDFNHFIVSRNSVAADVMGREGNSVAGRIQAAF
ncbi:porin [Komagataeibacter rhaeticus]|uniref:porin n=1 Tax=Komagataeibacter rhaeticus TaxID=215221 RepID=UPI001CD41610